MTLLAVPPLMSLKDQLCTPSHSHIEIVRLFLDRRRSSVIVRPALVEASVWRVQESRRPTEYVIWALLERSSIIVALLVRVTLTVSRMVWPKRQVTSCLSECLACERIYLSQQFDFQGRASFSIEVGQRLKYRDGTPTGHHENPGRRTGTIVIVHGVTVGCTLPLSLPDVTVDRPKSEVMNPEGKFAPFTVTSFRLGGVSPRRSSSIGPTITLASFGNVASNTCSEGTRRASYTLTTSSTCKQAMLRATREEKTRQLPEGTVCKCRVIESLECR